MSISQDRLSIRLQPRRRRLRKPIRGISATSSAVQTETVPGCASASAIRRPAGRPNASGERTTRM
jgi:hypothetical protein